MTPSLWEDVRAELVQRIREAKVKADTLEDERIKAHHAMREASAQHEFLVSACRGAGDALANARADLERAIERETWAAMAE